MGLFDKKSWSSSTKSLSPLILSVLLSVVIIGCKAEDSSDPQALSSGGNNPFSGETVEIKWTNSNLSSGLELKVSQSFIDDMPSKYNDGQNPHIIEQLQTKWDEVVSDQTLFQTDLASIPNIEYSDLKDYKDQEMGIYRSNSWFPELSSSTLAVTQYFGHRRNAGTPFEYIELSHADIVVNYRDYTYVWDNSETGNFGMYDLPSVLFHEIGHFLGLRHESASGPAVMKSTLSRFHRYRDLYAPDKEAISNLYDNSGTQTIQSGLTSVSDKEGEVVSGVLELSANGTCQHYRNGQLIHTHTISEELEAR